ALIFLARATRRESRENAILVGMGMLPFCLGVTVGAVACSTIDKNALSQALLIGFAFLVTGLTVFAARRTLAAFEAQVAGDAVRHSEARFRALSQNAADMVFLLDAAGRYLFASPSCVDGTGLR